MYCKACSRRIYYVNQYNIWIFTVAEIFSIIILIIFKATATIERRRSYARDAVGDSYACKATAIIERRIANARDAITYSYARKATATFERRIANARDAITYSYARNIRTIEKRNWKNFSTSYCYRF